MSVPSRFADPGYVNWLKCASSLVILKESLHDYTEAGVRRLHDNVKQSVTTRLGFQYQCSDCSYKGIHLTKSRQGWCIKCNKSICNVWLDEILNKHNEPQCKTINWRNADITQWPTDPWEIAKIYMTKGQWNNANLPQELDTPALLSLLMFCREFDPIDVQLVSKIIDTRNKVLHSPDLSVSDTDKDTWMDCMLALVSSLNIQGVAYTNIYKLKKEDIDVSFRDQEIRALQYLVSEVLNEVKALKGDSEELSNVQIQHREEIDKVKETAGDHEAKIIGLKTQTQQLETDLRGQESQMESYIQVISSLKGFIDNNPELSSINLSEELSVTSKEIHSLQRQLQTVESQLVSFNGQLILIRSDQEKMKTEMRVEHQASKGEITAVKDGQEKMKTEMRVEHHASKGEITAVRNQIENLEQDQIQKQTEMLPSSLITAEVQQHQKNLLLYYKSLSVVPISSLYESYTTLLDIIFTRVLIEKIDPQSQGHLQDKVQPSTSKQTEYLRSYHQLFGDKESRRLIITGFMGSGKTVFCRKVVQTWCRVKTTQVEPESAGEIQVSSTNALEDEDRLSQFEFLFFVDMTKVNNGEDLLHAIQRQCSMPDNTENKNFLCKLLQEMPEEVLIILDGLDEMGSKAPNFVNDLLERRLYPQITVLVSTRPWQISKLGLQAHAHYDLLLDVQGFDDEGALDFASKVIQAHDKGVSDSLVKDMTESLKRKKIFATFRNVPLLLLFLINVWCSDRTLPDQHSVLYSNIIDCMIKLCLNKSKGKYTNLDWIERSDSSIKAVESSLLVKTFGISFLKLISKLSYQYLHQRQQGTTITISREELLNALDKTKEIAESKLFFLRDCGIFSHSDAFSPLERKFCISFLHFSLQEFLATFHLILNENVLQELLSSWTCLDDVLQNENLVIFTCGLAPNLGEVIFNHICQVCDQDSKVLEYRQGSYEYVNAIENLSSLYEICLNEVGTSASLPLSDIIVGESENFLTKLMTLNLATTIKSFHMKKKYTNIRPLCKMVSSCIHLQKLCLYKISVHDSSLDLNRLTSLINLRLGNLTMSSEGCKSLCRSISNCTHLQTVHLSDITLHDGILDLGSLTSITDLTLENLTISSECCKSLCRSISNFTHLQTFHLSDITLHDGILDLSSLTSLIDLGLQNLTMSSECCKSLCRSISNCTHLQILHLDKITLHDGILDLSSLTSLTDLGLQNLTMSSECCKSFCRSISNCTHLETFHLSDITLHDGILDLSSLTSITDLFLWNLTMSDECCKSLFSSISNCTHMQTVHLSDITLHDGILDLSSLTSLTDLSLENLTMSSECCKSFCRSMRNCTYLQTLDLSNITLHDGILDLSSLTSLTELSLWNLTMSSECCKSLCRSISNCAHMQTLHLYNNTTLHDGILDLSSLTSLTDLGLQNLIMSSECCKSLCRSISNCAHMQTIHLSNITLHDGILDLSSLTSLTKLRLQNLTMSSECCKSLCRSISNCAHMQTLDLSNTTLHDGILDLSRLTSLTDISLENLTMSSDDIKSLCRSISNCTHLQTLHLSNITLNDHMHDLSRLTSLTDLSLENWTMFSGIPLCRNISKLTHMQTLDLDKITLHDGILDLSSLTSLTKLSLWNLTMSSECSKSLCRSISNYTHLQTLYLSNITLHDGILDLSSLTSLTNLRLLYLTMSNECCKSLYRSISNCTHLQTLYLSNITLHDGILDLSSLTSLTDLNLTNLTMSSEYCKSFCSCISNCTHLQTLNLSNTTLHDGILDLSSLTSLTELSLWNLTMSSECCKSLCRSISNCTHMQTLHLYNNTTLHDGILDMSSLTSLTVLNLTNLTMSNECCKSLYRSISNCTNLQTLHLSNITLGHGILDLSSLTSLTELSLWNLTMSSECCKSLCRSISYCTHMQTIHLFYITLHDGILDMSSLTSLTDLNLTNLTMSNECCKSLYRSISNCTNLQTLHLSNITLGHGILDLSSLTSLTELSLWNLTMSSECCKSLCRSISYCTHMQTIHLFYITLHDGILDMSSLTSLTDLNLTNLTMSNECCKSLYRSISNCTNLQTLHLSNITLGHGILDLSRLSSLTDLSLENLTMSSECCKSLCRSMSNCTRMQTLHFSDITLHDGILDLSRLTSLTKLSRINVTMSSECCKSLCRSISNFTHLQTLHLSNITLRHGILDLRCLTSVTDLGLQNLTMSSECCKSLCRSISNCTHLQTLHLDKITLHDGILDLSSLTSLTDLGLQNLTMSSECCKSLCRSISNCTHLQILHLDKITLHDGILDLSSLTSLTDLGLQNLTISSECCKSLCRSISNSNHLQTLHLSNITLHDGILDLGRLTCLTKLRLSNLTMSSDGSKSLCRNISNCTHLQTLHLSNVTLHDGILDLSRLTGLTDISLWSLTMSSECCKYLRRNISEFPWMQTLKLTMYRKCSKSLCRSITKCTHLQILNLHKAKHFDKKIALSYRHYNKKRDLS